MPGSQIPGPQFCDEELALSVGAGPVPNCVGALAISAVGRAAAVVMNVLAITVTTPSAV